MKSSEAEIQPILGTSMGGGFYAGRVRVGADVFALILAPKADGEITGPWSASSKNVEGADSYFDGVANTLAMAGADSELALAARALRVGDCDDWYIPSQDELEIIYRNLKPTTDKNSHYGRSGLNASAVTPTYPYTPTEPAQTLADVFQAGGAEAFEGEWYWSSTQRASNSDFAWSQYFSHGTQSFFLKSHEGRARAVRRLPI